MSDCVLRYEVPVDGEDHELSIRGVVVHVAASRNHRVVELWARTNIDARATTSRYRVFGTGQSVPESATYVGTGLTDVGLVWHLFRW